MIRKFKVLSLSKRDAHYRKRKLFIGKTMIENHVDSVEASDDGFFGGWLKFNRSNSFPHCFYEIELKEIK